MAYKKYITRKGKKFGPYYYASVRGKNGKINTVYLGSTLKKSREKEAKLKTVSRRKSTKSPKASKPFLPSAQFRAVRLKEVPLGYAIVFVLLIGLAAYHYSDTPITGFMGIGNLEIAGSDCFYNASSWDYPNWTINTSQTCVVTDMTNISLEGNLTINGILRFENVTLHVNATSDGSHSILVNGSGTFTMNASSNITNNETAAAEYDFTIAGSFEANDSTIDRVNSRIHVIGNYSNFTNMTFTNPNDHLVVFNATTGGRVQNSTFISSSASSYGIIVYHGATDINLSGNTLTSSGSSGNGLLVQDADTLGTYIGQNVITASGASSYALVMSTVSGNTTFINNTLTSAVHSVSIMTNVNNTTFLNNSFLETGGASDYGVWLRGVSKFNVFAGNVINISSAGTGNFGFNLQSVGGYAQTDNAISNNTVVTHPGSSGRAIVIAEADAHRNVMRNNVITSSQYGFYIASKNNTVDNNTVRIDGTSGYGIFTANTANASIIINNVINTTGSKSTSGIELNDNRDAKNVSGNTITVQDRPGITVTGYQAFISFNVITTYASSGWGAMLLSGSSPVTILSNTITAHNGSDGILIDADPIGSNISLNTINTTGLTAHGIFFDDAGANYVSLEGNTIYTNGSGSHGIYLSGINFINISDSTITVTGPGATALNMSDSTNNIIKSSTFNSTNHNAIVLQGASTDNNLSDSILESIATTGLDVVILGGSTSNITITNTTLDSSKISFAGVAASAIINDVALTISVQNTDSAAGISGANVNVTNSTGDIVFNSTTGATGVLVATLRESIFSLVQNATTSNFTVNVTYTNASVIESFVATVVNISTTNSVTAQFTEDNASPTLVFNASTNENVTRTSNSVVINVSISDALSAIDEVILDWNGVNETITTNDSTHWWVTKTSLSNANYTFQVYANDSRSNLGSTYMAWADVNVAAVEATSTSASGGGGGSSTAPTGQLPGYLVRLPNTIVVEISEAVTSATFTVTVENRGGVPVTDVVTALDGIPLGVTYQVTPIQASIEAGSVQVFRVTLHVSAETEAKSYPLKVLVRTPSRILTTADTILSVRAVEFKPGEGPIPGTELEQTLVPTGPIARPVTVQAVAIGFGFVLALLMAFSMLVKDLELFLPISVDLQMFDKIMNEAELLGLMK